MIMQRFHALRGVLMCAALGTFLAGLSSSASAEDYIVIANKSVTAGGLSKSEAQSIFLGDKTRWEVVKPIEFAIIESGEVQKTFLQEVLGKTPSQFDSYWKRLIFTGKASAPKAFGDEKKMLEFVAATPGAVGFVSAGKADASVKTLSIK